MIHKGWCIQYCEWKADQQPSPKRKERKLIALVMTLLPLNPVLAVCLRAQVPEGQRGHACRDHEHLRASEGEAAGPVLLRPQRAAGDRSPDQAVRPHRRLPHAALALLHAHGRGPHYRDGEAHAVPLQTVRADREDLEVKDVQQLSEHTLIWWRSYDMNGIVSTKQLCCDLLQTFFFMRHPEQLTLSPDRGCDCLYKWTECSQGG